MIVSPLALLLPLVLSVSPTSAAFFQNTPRCGDCWCITDGEPCPSDTVGLADGFYETDKLYATFELANDPDFLKLKSASGEPCYPFADSFDGPLANYPESGAAQCVKPTENGDVVCAYVYDASSTTCEGRKYRMQEFASLNDAMGASAHVVHKGACGVCSSAQDFGAYINTYGTLETESIACATSYTFSRDFEALVECYGALGFTGSCATLWAHFAATNGSNCMMPCFPGLDGVTELNGPAPLCEPSKCLECQADFLESFNNIAGFEATKAGITERIAHSCNDFYRVLHDPCIGLDGAPAPDPPPVEDPVETPEVTSSESESAGKYVDTSIFAVVVTISLSSLGTAWAFV